MVLNGFRISTQVHAHCALEEKSWAAIPPFNLQADVLILVFF